MNFTNSKRDKRGFALFAIVQCDANSGGNMLVHINTLLPPMAKIRFFAT